MTETEYDGEGHVSAQIDGNKHKTTYARNILGQVKEVEDALKHKTTKEYDLAGNLEKLTDPAKRTTTYKYDAANRLSEVTYSDGKTHSVKYEYDADGDRTKMEDATGTSKYTYDELDRLTESEDGHKDLVKYEYDLANQQTKLTYPSTKAVTREYDSAGRVKSVTDWATNTIKFAYDQDSNLETITYPSNADTNTYNEADQLSKTVMKKGTEELASLTYAHDPDGQLESTTQAGLPGEATTSYSYDENNRLTKGGTLEYKYDEADNPTKTGATTQTFNEGNELTEGTGVKSYSYDELGERTNRSPTTGPATTYGYDQAGDLTSVERKKEGETSEINDSYGYDGNALRASQTISGTTSYFAWDVSGSLPLLINDGTNSYIYGPSGLPVEQISSVGTVTYPHTDRQGSTRLLTSSAGAKEASFTYDAYGNQTGHTGTATTPLGYDGQYTSSDTGLIYLRARSYDPATALFVTVDPVVPVSRAPYNYGSDNPVNTTDPTGLLCLSLSLSCAEEDAGQVGEATLRVGATAVKYSPAGLVLQAASGLSGMTLGACVSGSFVGGGAAHARVCYVATPSGQSGFTGSLGGGAGFPIGGSILVTGLISNGQTLSDQGKQFTGAGGSAGEGPIIGGSYEQGRSNCGRVIWQATAGLGYGTQLPMDVLASGYAGTSYTWTIESF